MSRSGSTSTASADRAWPGLLNLLVPGAGVIWLGGLASGLLLGLGFALCANLAVWSVLLVPDDWSAGRTALVVLVTGMFYVAAQIALVRARQAARRRDRQALRHAALARARERLLAEDYAGALAALAPLESLAGEDLLVAVRVAEARSGLDDVAAARAAWQHVRALDRHGLYRDQVRSHEAALDLGTRRTPPG